MPFYNGHIDGSSSGDVGGVVGHGRDGSGSGGGIGVGTTPYLRIITSTMGHTYTNRGYGDRVR